MNDKLKLPYAVLSLEVDKLYPPHYELKPGETAESHCEDITDFIEACGWTVEEYLEEYIHRGLEELFPNTKDMN
jgi:hypothetical protein